MAEGIDEILPANNNVGAALYRGALYMGWRSAPTHFATDRFYTSYFSDLLCPLN